MSEQQAVALPITRTGLAGLELGATREQVFVVLGSPTKSTVRLQQGTELLDYAGIRLVLDYESGEVFAMFALGGYRGTTAEGLAVGASWSEALARAPGIHYDEDRMDWFIESDHRIALEIGRPLRRGESSDDGWAEEVYKVTDPEHAFIAVIAVCSPD